MKSQADLSDTEARVLARLLLKHPRKISRGFGGWTGDEVEARDALIERGYAELVDYYGWTTITPEGVLALTGRSSHE